MKEKEFVENVCSYALVGEGGRAAGQAVFNTIPGVECAAEAQQACPSLCSWPLTTQPCATPPMELYTHAQTVFAGKFWDSKIDTSRQTHTQCCCVSLTVMMRNIPARNETEWCALLLLSLNQSSLSILEHIINRVLFWWMISHILPPPPVRVSTQAHVNVKSMKLASRWQEAIQTCIECQVCGRCHVCTNDSSLDGLKEFPLDLLNPFMIGVSLIVLQFTK